MALIVRATVMDIATIQEDKKSLLKEATVDFTDENDNLIQSEKFVYNDVSEDRRNLKSLLISNCRILLRSSNLEDTIDIGTSVDSK